jgi:predicted ATP-grasp superfamily ATP-dependent carboligase
LKLLVYEHASGGGFAEKPFQQGVLTEGFAMLRALVSDFKAAGHQVTTLLDSRVAKLNPPIGADCVVPVSSSQEANEALLRAAASVNAAYVIAPETDGALQLLVESLEQTGVTLLNCPARAVGSVADKAALHKHLRKLGVPTPETMVFSVVDDVAEVKRAVGGNMGFPVVFKPLDGISCQGLSVVRDQREVAGAVGKLRRDSACKRFVAQKLVDGVAASVCLISTGSEALPISLNKQDVTLDAPDKVSSYDGGLVPFDSPLRGEAFAAAEKVVGSFRDLRGFVGVDLVLTEDEPVVVEVNPRLTMSCVGLRKVVNCNLAQAIVDAVLLHKLPRDVQTCGYAYFSKMETCSPTIGAFQEACKMSEVVSPPFPVAGDGATCAIVLSHGDTLEEAMTRFSQAKKRFLTTMHGGR